MSEPDVYVRWSLTSEGDRDLCALTEILWSQGEAFHWKKVSGEDLEDALVGTCWARSAVYKFKYLSYENGWIHTPERLYKRQAITASYEGPNLGAKFRKRDKQ